MDPIRIGHITNSDVYMDNNRLIGRVKEFELPEFSYKLISHEALGQIAILELPSRALEAPKGKITFDFVDHEVERLALNPTVVRRWQLHSYVDIWGADGLDRAKSHKLITSLGLLPTKSGALAHTLGEAVNREMEITVPYITQVISTEDVPLLELDVFAGIYRINGENVWPD
ncbi:phage major tail tube protein [Xanthobacter sp. VTT E-85241]|uniref:phage major tail tube protein n=1 Tax=Roseixanthobacter finlandensis TaxID=3119922 RepID=UPI003729A1E6